MRVDADDRRVAAGADGGVQPHGDVRSRVADEPDALVRLSEPLSQLRRPIGGGAESQHEFRGHIDVLSEHGLDRVLQVGVFVEHRHHEGHPGQGSG